MKEQLQKYLDAIVEDYRKWENSSDPVFTDQRVQEFKDGLRIKEGKNYFKVISRSSVHSFIVKEDGPKFKKGDILKAASWAAPMKNKARGNILADYQTQWTGAIYLR